MKIVRRKELIEVLVRWIDGAPEKTIHVWAEQRYSSNYKAEDEVTNEILARLDMMDINLTTVEDAHVFLASLRSSSVTQSMAVLERHDTDVDIDSRKAELSDVEFYSRFTQTD